MDDVVKFVRAVGSDRALSELMYVTEGDGMVVGVVPMSQLVVHLGAAAATKVADLRVNPNAPVHRVGGKGASLTNNVGMSQKAVGQNPPNTGSTCTYTATTHHDDTPKQRRTAVHTVPAGCLRFTPRFGCP